jgi:hypothetical protein
LQVGKATQSTQFVLVQLLIHLHTLLLASHH